MQKKLNETQKVSRKTAITSCKTKRPQKRHKEMRPCISRLAFIQAENYTVKC